MLGDAAKTLSRMAVPLDEERADPRRVALAVRQHYPFIWRSLRRLGLQAADVDDAAQQVLTVFARRLADIAIGTERGFLFQTALRVASDARRAFARSPIRVDEDALAFAPDQAPNAEQQLERREARALLDEVLDAMAPDLRVVFILFELEEMTTVQIATLIEIPAGTVSSRLHRARQEFEAMSVRVQARRASGGRRP